MALKFIIVIKKFIVVVFFILRANPVLLNYQPNTERFLSLNASISQKK